MTSSRAVPGSSRLFLLASLASLASLSLLACSTSDREDNRAEARADNSASATQSSTGEAAAFALGYQPGAGEAAIADAQRQAREAAGEAKPYVALAEAFLARRRETADPALLGYATDALDAALAIAPNDPDVLTARMQLLLDGHRFAEVAQLARSVIELRPGDATAYLLLSDALLELGDYEGAIAAAEDAMDRHPDVRSYSRAAYLAWLHGEVDGALDLMDAALQFAGRAEPAAWCTVDLGQMLWLRGQLREARAAADRALALVPGYLPALSLSARIDAAEGRAGDAIATLAEVVERLPTAANLILLSELLEADGQTEKAAARLAQAERMAEHDPLPVALHYARVGRAADRALALAKKAVAERATVFHHDALALALLRTGQVDEAAAAMTKALALHTPDARMHLHRGLIELARGDRAAAADALRAAERLNPHADPALAAELRRGLEG